MMKTKPCLLIFAILATAAASNTFAQDCEQSQALFDQGLDSGKSGNWAEAIDSLKKSTDLCARYDNWYLLGQAEFSAKQYIQAEQAFIQARRYAENDDKIALALARYAETRNAQGFASEASNLLHDARSLHSEAPQWMTQLALNIDASLSEQALSESLISKALTELPPKSFHRYQPKYSLRLNFEFNSDSLVNPEAFDPKIVVQALSSKDLEGKHFSLIGHSDTRGQDSYNQQLSVKRAHAIREAVVAIAPQLADRISVEGKGEAAPLYQGDSEQEHLLNRRVEIAVID